MDAEALSATTFENILAMEEETAAEEVTLKK